MKRKIGPFRLLQRLPSSFVVVVKLFEQLSILFNVYTNEEKETLDFISTDIFLENGID